MESCSICLNPVPNTRQARELPCHHMFHKRCIHEWETNGGKSCPTCRHCFTEPEYKLTIIIENTRTGQTVTEQGDQDVLSILFERLSMDRSFSTAELSLTADTFSELQEIISDFGLVGVDLNSLVLDAE